LRDVTELVEATRAGYPDCFVCGAGNPIGMHLAGFALDDDGDLVARFRPRPEYRGSGDTLHGGIAAAAIDEICVWAGVVATGVLTVTATLDLRYRRPVTVADDVTARGRVLERRGRRFRMGGELVVAGRVAVEGAGLFVAAGEGA